MSISGVCATRRDHSVASAEEIIPALEERQQLSLRFPEGHGTLKPWIAGWRPTKERGFVHVYDAFTIAGDNQGEDYHRDPTPYVALMKKLESLNRSAVEPRWEIRGLQSLLGALWKIAMAGAPWNRHGVPWRAVAQYIRALTDR